VILEYWDEDGHVGRREVDRSEVTSPYFYDRLRVAHGHKWRLRESMVERGPIEFGRVVGFDSAKNVGWVQVLEDGDVRFSGPGVVFCGSLKGDITAPIGGIRLTGDGKGYWIWQSDGRVVPFGTAQD
jgi:hypothetical protein